MKLGIVNDFLIEHRAGGASRAIKLLLTEASQRYAPRSIEPVLCTPGNVDETCDAYLVFLAKRFTDDELGYIQARPFVECGFDWWPDEDGNTKWRNLLYEKARLTVFVSPLHQMRFCRLYGAAPPRTLVLPPPLDLAPLRALYGTVEQQQGGVWAAEWHAAKGPDLAAVLARRLELHTDMYSPSMPANIRAQATAFTPFAHPRGFMPEEQWYPTLARYATLLHTPRVPDAFGYIALEAYALGLEVQLTGQTGVESYGMPFDAVLEWCGRSAGEFWDAVERAL